MGKEVSWLKTNVMKTLRPEVAVLIRLFFGLTLYPTKYPNEKLACSIVVITKVALSGSLPMSS